MSADLLGCEVEVKKCAITWHYRNADEARAVPMSRECQTELEQTVARDHDVEVMPGKANIEVRPRFINKGEISKRLLKLYNRPSVAPKLGGTPAETITKAMHTGGVDFVLCTGDDFTDEDMFRAINVAVDEEGARDDQVFTATVGASTKATLAKYHLLEPEDVIECVVLLAGSERTGEVNLAAIADVEGMIPEGEK